jgi:hypothetical protein
MPAGHFPSYNRFFTTNWAGNYRPIFFVNVFFMVIAFHRRDAQHRTD